MLNSYTGSMNSCCRSASLHVSTAAYPKQQGRNHGWKVEGGQEPDLFHMTYSDRLLSLQLDSLEARRVKCDLIFCHKIIHGLVDLNSADFFRFATSFTRGHSFKLQKQHSLVDARKLYFSNRVADAWNHLPDHVVNVTSLSSFKRRFSLTTIY